MGLVHHKPFAISWKGQLFLHNQSRAISGFPGLKLQVLWPNSDPLPSVEMSSSHQQSWRLSTVRWLADRVPCEISQYLSPPSDSLEIWTLFRRSGRQNNKTWKGPYSRMSAPPADLWVRFARPRLKDQFESLRIVSFSLTYYYKMVCFPLPSEWVGKSISHSQENHLDGVLRASLLFVCLFV